MSQLHYPIDELPQPGEKLCIAPGVYWLRFPLPFALDHINLWLLEEIDGWTLVDTGIGLDETRALWRELFASQLEGKPLLRILVTHFHPDHFGLAGWLQAETGATVSISAAEYAKAQGVCELSDAQAGRALAELFRRHGLDEPRAAQIEQRGNRYRHIVPSLPQPVETLVDGQRIDIGGKSWQVVVGRGHAPEQATLHCAELGLLISGDQVLPRISSNVSVYPGEEGGDPLGDYLESLDRFAELPADTRVLPSHGRVFEGLRPRLAELREHHRERLDELLAACDAPRSAAELLPTLFRRELDVHQLGFAMGEAIAHLIYLQRRGELHAECGEDGVIRYQRGAGAAAAVGGQSSA